MEHHSLSAELPFNVRIMPKPVTTPNRRVVALAYEELCTFEFGITAEVFGLTRPETGTDWYSFAACAERPGRLATNAGSAVQVDDGLEMLASAGTVVIPGWRSEGEPPSKRLHDALLAAHE
jgi:AraC family transcriptional activator FtrA